jgi:hypothetical protein
MRKFLKKGDFSIQIFFNFIFLIFLLIFKVFEEISEKR